MTKIKSKNVLITGGASGIGKLLGEQCLEKGANKIIIWDINESALNKTSEEFKAKGYAVHPYLVDVSDLAQIIDTSKKVLDQVGTVDILINNAGIVTGKPFHEQDHKSIDKTLDINTAAVMHITRAFIKPMIDQKSGHIINIASAAAMMSNPNMSIYAGSKWAVLGWSESLRLELESLEGYLHVTTVTPSYIDTGMFDGVKAPLLLPMLKPDSIVKAIISGIEKNKLFVRKPFMVNSLPFIRGILPTRAFDWFVGNILKVYKSMDEFKGH
mgnify:CR=1 FL=1